MVEPTSIDKKQIREAIDVGEDLRSYGIKSRELPFGVAYGGSCQMKPGCGLTAPGKDEMLEFGENSCVQIDERLKMSHMIRAHAILLPRAQLGTDVKERVLHSVEPKRGSVQRCHRPTDHCVRVIDRTQGMNHRL